MRRPLVLLVEDDEVLSEIIPSLLEEEGIEVVTFREERPVIGAIAHYRPNAVVLDISLPDIDGLRVARVIRDGWPGLPIIMTTGFAESSVPLALRDARTITLEKPYEIASLVAAVKALSAPTPR